MQRCGKNSYQLNFSYLNRMLALTAQFLLVKLSSRMGEAHLGGDSVETTKRIKLTFS